MKSVLITGANRGFGLELVKQYLAMDCTVRATYRSPSESQELFALKDAAGERLSIHHLEMSDEHGLERFGAEMLRLKHLDVLINNAGVSLQPFASLAELRAKDYLWTMHVNAVAPVMVTKYCLSALKSGAGPARVINVSSRLGSLSGQNEGGYYAYRASKAALNSFTTTLAASEPGLIVVSVTPGWMRTRMGGDGAKASAVDSARELIALETALTPSMTGRFVDLAGGVVEW